MTKNSEPANPGRSLLGDHLVGFSRWLEEHGYAASTVEQYRLIAGRFDRYVTDHDLDVRHLDERHREAYLKQVEPRRPNGRKAVIAELLPWCLSAAGRVPPGAGGGGRASADCSWVPPFSVSTCPSSVTTVRWR